MPEIRRPGLRVQIVVALAVLMALVFIPLFFAVASLTQATLRVDREALASAIARSVATHAEDARRSGMVSALPAALASHIGEGGIETACVYGEDGAVLACAGDLSLLPLVSPAAIPYQENLALSWEPRGRVADVLIPIYADDGEGADNARVRGGSSASYGKTPQRHAHAALLARIRLGDEAARAAPLLGLVAIYTSVFALSLLTFAYFALTRLIVRPIDALAAAADRVASGAATLGDSPIRTARGGAREIGDLAASVAKMTARLVAEESALRAKVHELTITTKHLGETRQQLVRSERLASVGRLAAGVAHEIGNPITALMGLEDLLLDGDLPPAVQRDFLERIKRETNRIHAVVRDLLDFARPDSDPVHAGIEPRAGDSAPRGTRSGAEGSVGQVPTLRAAVGDVLAEVTALARPQPAFRQIQLSAELPEGPVYVAMAGDRLLQVALNLTLNAADAIETMAPSGAPGSSAKVAREMRITWRVRSDGVLATLDIEDTGPGIPKGLADRVFDPFVTTKDVGKGTGLGLAVCRGLVESAGGTIRVDTSYTEGARFRVVLPLARDREQEAAGYAIG